MAKCIIFEIKRMLSIVKKIKYERYNTD